MGEVYGGHSAVKLRQLTHEKGTPWDITWNRKGAKTTPSTDILFGDIERYYQEEIEIRLYDEAKKEDEGTRIPLADYLKKRRGFENAYGV